MTFSVASTVRSATSLRICSQRAPRLGLDVALGGRDQLLALLLARGGRLGLGRLGRLAGAGHDVVGLLARLGEPLAVLVEQLVGLLALPFGRLDRLAIVFARLSSASWIFGKATLLSTHIVKRKRTSVQIIRPRPGETRKLPPSSSPALGGERERATM